MSLNNIWEGVRLRRAKYAFVASMWASAVPKCANLEDTAKEATNGKPALT